MQALFSSEKMNWETPQMLFKKLDNIFKFEVDVAADENNKKCKKYYSLKEDGLNQTWRTERGGAVWCNPPYGRDIKKWVEKAYKESKLHNTTIVMLIPSRTDTQYFHDYIYNKAKLFFIRGRLKFINEKKQEEHSAPFPSMIVIYNSKGENLEAINER